MSISRNNNSAATVVGIILFSLFLLGFMTFLINRSIITIFPSIFIIIFVIIFIVSISSIVSKSRRPRGYNEYKSNNQLYTQKSNPYRVQSSQEEIKTSQYQRIEEEIELQPFIRFCQYCGTKIERDAMFCHKCGSKLE